MKKILTITNLCCSIFLTGNIYAAQGIDGDWYNDVGSKMSITAQGNQISGTYQTNVGDGDGLYPLTGYLNASSPDNPQAIGWTVLWNNDTNGDSHSITSWSGQYDSSKQQIDSFWVLTSTDSEGWDATKLGHVVFYPEEQVIKGFPKGIKKGGISYPLPKKFKNGLSLPRPDSK